MSLHVDTFIVRNLFLPSHPITAAMSFVAREVVAPFHEVQRAQLWTFLKKVCRETFLKTLWGFNMAKVHPTFQGFKSDGTIILANDDWCVTTGC